MKKMKKENKDMLIEMDVITDDADSKTQEFFGGLLDVEIIKALSALEITHLKRTYLAAQKYLK